MKKFTLLTVLALGLFVASSAGAAWVMQINKAGGNDSIFNAKLEMEKELEVSVYNNAVVSITEVDTNTTGIVATAGDDMENSNFNSGDITQTNESYTSVNDVAILVDPGSATTTEEAIYQENADDDTILNADVEIEDEAELQTANNLDYVETSVVTNSTATVVASGDDMEGVNGNTGTVSQFNIRSRTLGRVTIVHGGDISVSL